jgi:glucarate dehydratase
MAVCAVEMAMWDAAGKAMRAPVCSLLGGRWRDKVDIAGYLLIQDAARLAEAATELKRQGYRQFKVKVGSGEENDIRLARAARQALGDGVHLRLDVNGAWTRFTAKRQLLRLAELDLAYVEQPLEMDDLEGSAALRRCQPVPIALDESVYTVQDVVNAINADAADVMLLDAHETGGLWQARKAAAITEGFGIMVGLHSGGELGLSQAANLHLAASIPDMRLAIDSMYEDFRDDILTQRLEVVAGQMAVPTGPGLGVVPDLDKLERYRTDAVRGAYLDDSRPGWFPLKPAY